MCGSYGAPVLVFYISLFHSFILSSLKYSFPKIGSHPKQPPFCLFDNFGGSKVWYGLGGAGRRCPQGHGFKAYRPLYGKCLAQSLLYIMINIQCAAKIMNISLTYSVSRVFIPIPGTDISVSV